MRPQLAAGSLLILLFVGFLFGGLREPAYWTVVSLAIWGLSWLGPGPDLSALRRWGFWLGWAALSVLVSAQPAKGLYPLARWAGVLVFFGLACRLWGERERALWVRGLLATAVVLGAAAALSGAERSWTGLLPPYYNYTGFVLGAAFAAALALGSRERPRPWVLAGLFLVVLLLIRSRGGLAAASCGTLALILTRGARRGAALVCLGVLAGGLALTTWLKADKLPAFKRPQLWTAALEVAAERPLLGQGLGNFADAFPRHAFPAGFGLGNYRFTSDHAHSEPLELAAETGWVGLALFLWALAGALRRGRRDAEGQAALCAAAAMGTHCLIDNMLHLPSLALLFFSALAVSRPAAEAGKAPKGWQAAALAGLLLAGLAWVPGGLARSWLSDAGREADPEARVALLRRRAALYPADAEARDALARGLMGLPRPDLAFAEWGEASRLNPRGAVYPVMRAELLRARGAWGEVAALAGTALSLEPDFVQARLLRAEALARLGRKEEARAELAELARRRPALEAAGPFDGYLGFLFSLDRERLRLVGNVIESSR